MYERLVKYNGNWIRTVEVIENVTNSLRIGP